MLERGFEGPFGIKLKEVAVWMLPAPGDKPIRLTEEELNERGFYQLDNIKDYQEEIKRLKWAITKHKEATESGDWGGQTDLDLWSVVE